MTRIGLGAHASRVLVVAARDDELLDRNEQSRSRGIRISIPLDFVNSV